MSEASWTIPSVEPTGDPAWYRMVEPCEEGCHHPVHTLLGKPERRRHLVEADLATTVIAWGWIDPRSSPEEGGTGG